MTIEQIQEVVMGTIYHLEDNGMIEIKQTFNVSTLMRYVKSHQNTKSKSAISKRFEPPSIDDVQRYCIERKNSIDAVKWHDFYASKGWMVGKNRMKDWKAAVRTWENNQNNGKTIGNNSQNSVASGVIVFNV